MDFAFSDEQQLLQDTLRRYLDKEYTFEARRKLLTTPLGWSEAAWAKYAELGLLGIPFAEEFGGLGGSGVDTMVVMNAFGRGLVVEPYFATVVLGGAALAHGGSDAHKQELLPALIEGRLKLAFAHGEPQARHDLAWIETTARRDGDGYSISGAKAVVWHGDCADRLVVSARTGGAPRDAAGLSLFLVDAKAKGVAVRGYRTIDGQHAAEVRLDNVRVGRDTVLGQEDDAWPLIESVVDRGIAALTAEAVGIMEALNEATLNYLKTRQQFGVPIGRFQVLQHRMAEMLIYTEQAKSMSYLAAVQADSAEAEIRRHALSAAKAQIGMSGRFVGQQAVQLHGGMGVVDELNVSHYFKRLTIIENTLGDTAYHLGKVGDAVLPKCPD